MEKPTLVTDHAQFYRAKSLLGEYRFFPFNENGKEAARKFGGDYTAVAGYGVYDTTVSTAYAVMLCATRKEAEDYTPVEAPKPPEAMFEQPAAISAGFEAEGISEPFANPAPTKGPMPARGGFKRK